MRDFRDAKAMAQTLRSALAAMDFKITVSQSLELIAQAFGVADWNTLSAAMRAQAPAVPEHTAQAPPGTESARTSGSARNSLSEELKSTLTQVFAYAKARKQEEVAVEHLLLGLLDDAEASRVMIACGVNLDDLRGKLTDYIDNDLKSEATESAGNPRPTLGFQRVLQRAVFHVQQADRFPVKTLNVFTAIFSEKHSLAVKLLNEQGVARIDVVNYISHGLLKGRGGSGDPG